MRWRQNATRSTTFSSVCGFPKHRHAGQMRSRGTAWNKEEGGVDPWCVWSRQVCRCSCQPEPLTRWAQPSTRSRGVSRLRSPTTSAIPQARQCVYLAGEARSKLHAECGSLRWTSTPPWSEGSCRTRHRIQRPVTPAADQGTNTAAM
jgi:hypothetical protein